MRLSVQIDLSKPLLSKFCLNGKVWSIQYEGIHLIYFHCRKLGHKEDCCPFVADSAKPAHMEDI